MNARCHIACPSLLASLAGLGLVPAARGDIVVESVHRAAIWQAVSETDEHGVIRDGFDITTTLDEWRTQHWSQGAYWAWNLGDYRTFTFPGGGLVIQVPVEGGATSMPYHDAMGSYINAETMMYGVGGQVWTNTWCVGSITGVLDAVFTVDRPSRYDFHAWGGGEASVMLWNEAGDLLLGSSGPFAFDGTLTPGRYRVLGNFQMSTQGPEVVGGLWVSVPGPGTAVLLIAGVPLVASRRRASRAAA